MGYRELIESLRKEGENKIQLLWNEAETQAKKIREKVSSRIEQIKKEREKIQAEITKEQEELILSKAKARARRIKLSAEKALSDRLFSLALSSLSELRNNRYKEIFTSLINELPDMKWKEVRVNPVDIKIAQGFFPDARIIPDNSIAGGLEVKTENERMHVINTFEKRLERAWEDLLPRLIRYIYKEI